MSNTDPKPAGKTRASIFDADAEPDIDLSAFVPKPGPDRTAPPAEAVRQVSEAAKFRSRERTASPPPVPAPAKREPRRHRTGRNVQFNVKVSQETFDAFYAIADGQGWVLGETLEHALAALQSSLVKGKNDGS